MEKQMNLKQIEIVSTIIVISCMLVGAICSFINNNLAAIIIMAGAFIGFGMIWHCSKNLFHFLGLVYLGFVFPLGMANLRLANYQQEWEIEAWLCFILAVVCFNTGYMMRNIFLNQLTLKLPVGLGKKRISSYEWMFNFGVFVFCCLLSGFFIKWWVAGSLPLFEWGDAHTYIYYLSGEGYLDTLKEEMINMPFLFLLIKIYHRFSTIFMFQGWLASCAVYAYCVKCHPKTWKKIVSWIIIVVSTIIPYLIVVREIFMMQTIAFAVFGYLINQKKFYKYSFVLIMAIITMVGFVGMSRTRGYSKNQIAEVFEMNEKENESGKPGKEKEPDKGREPEMSEEISNTRYPATVIWIYTYFTCGFDNFNYLTKTLDYYTYGLMELRPVFSALQIKGLMDVDMKLQDDKYRVSPNVTIYTFLCDAYVDFGLLGVIGSMYFWGLIFGLVSEICLRYKGAVSTILYSGFGHHVIFMAFVSWMGHFSYLCSFGLLLLYFIVWLMKGGKCEKQEGHMHYDCLQKV